MQDKLERVSKSAEAESTPEAATSSTREDKIKIASLQQELKEANIAIAEMKDALMNAISQNDMDNDQDATESSDNGGAPLYFAMEKQSELKTARDEINRLASLLSNIQAERSEAVEQLEETKTRLEAAESRLERLQKLGASSGSSENGESEPGTKAKDSATNIEYLKNIMMSFLNAKTLQEKKALVPVIGAVLCLTQREQEAAIKNLDDGAVAASASSLFQSYAGNFLK